MKQQLRNISSDTITLRNRAIKKVYFLVHTTNDAVNTAIATTDIDLSKIRIDLSLVQGVAGQQKTLNSSFNAIGPVTLGILKSERAENVVGMASTGLTCSGKSVLTHAAAIKGQAILQIPIIDTAIILKGHDSLTINYDLLSGHFGTACDTDSKVYLCVEDGVGLTQLDMELPVFVPVTADKNQIEINEMSISELALLDSGTSAEDDVRAFTGIEIKSKHFNDRFDSVQLRLLQFMNCTQPTPYLSVPVIDVNPDALESVTINASIDTAVVTSNNQFLFYKKVLFNQHVASRQIHRTKKINVRKAVSRRLINS